MKFEESNNMIKKDFRYFFKYTCGWLLMHVPLEIKPFALILTNCLGLVKAISN